MIPTKTALLALVLAVPCLLAAGEAQSSLKKFTSREGGFSVLLPEMPTERKVPDGKGGVLQYQFLVGRKEGAYLVSYQDNPHLRKASKEELAKALRTAQDTAQASVKGKVLRAKEITLAKKYPGREYEFATPLGGGGIFRSRAYLVDGRLYQLIVVGEREFATSKEATEFLDSFQLAR